MKQRTEKISNDEKVELMFDLINSFKNLKDSTEIANFLQDLLTANEIKNLSIRLRIAKLLIAGSSQREIVLTTHSSLGTVNKVNIWLEKGGDGFRKVISRLPIKWAKPDKIPRGPLEFHLPELLVATGQYVVSNNQDKLPKKFLEKVDEKRTTDKLVKEMDRELYSK